MAAQAIEEAAELRTRITRSEAKCKVAEGEAAEGASTLAAVQEDLRKLHAALAQSLKVRDC